MVVVGNVFGIVSLLLFSEFCLISNLFRGWDEAG